MAFTLYEEGRRETLTEGAVEIVRTLRCEPWSSRGEAALQLLGYVRLLGGRLVRVRPNRDPDYPFAWCRQIDIGPIGNDGEEEYLTKRVASPNPLFNTADYSAGARMVCTYKSKDYTEDDGKQADSPSADSQQEIEIASMSWEFSGSAVTLPNKYLVWESAPAGGANQDDMPVMSEVSPTINVPKFDILLTRHFVLNKPTNAILANLGRINTNAFRVGRDSYAAGCLRFDSAQVSQRLTNRGLKFFECTYKFGVMGVWDNFIKNAAGEHDLGFVTWNRVFDPKLAFWRKPVWFGDPTRGIYLDDEGLNARPQTIGGTAKKGFQLLFNPRAN